MQPTVFTFEESAALKIPPRAGADGALELVTEMESAGMLPMTLAGVSSRLRSRGYYCRPQMLEVLIRSQVVMPAGI